MTTKSILSIVIVLLGAGATGAQTITQAFNEPTVGDVDKNYRLDTSVYANGLPLNVTGSTCVWDFSGVKATFPLLYDSIKSPSAAPGASNYPGATYAQKRDNIVAFFKSVSSPSQTEWLGAWSPSLTVTFTNSAIVAKYPMTLGFSSSDPVTGTFKYGSNSGACNGAIEVTADGTGTLYLPNGQSFQNVLRLRSVEHLTATIGPLSVGAIDQQIYAFYLPGKKYPLLTVQYQKYQLLAGTPTITAQAYGNISYFSLDNVTEHDWQALNVYPNPTRDIVRVEESTFPVLQELRLYNMQGLLLRKENDREISLRDYEPGIYFLEALSSRGRLRTKVIRE